MSWGSALYFLHSVRYLLSDLCWLNPKGFAWSILSQKWRRPIQLLLTGLRFKEDAWKMNRKEWGANNWCWNWESEAGFRSAQDWTCSSSAEQHPVRNLSWLSISLVLFPQILAECGSVNHTSEARCVIALAHGQYLCTITVFIQAFGIIPLD